MKMMKIVAGIDLSLTSPSICIFSGTEFNFNKCHFYFLTSTNKLGKFYNERLIGTPFETYNCQEERYHKISGWALKALAMHHVTDVYIEDYAFAATGRVFHIAENGGVLKYRLWLSQYQTQSISPTMIKKFATGKGNAKKEDMQVAFIKETNYDVKDVLGLTDKQWNPSSDIIDSYFICKYGYENNSRSSIQL